MYQSIHSLQFYVHRTAESLWDHMYQSTDSLQFYVHRST